MVSIRKSLRASVRRNKSRGANKRDAKLEEEEEQPMLVKSESFARREKSGRSIVEPRLLTKKKSSPGGRISLPRLRMSQRGGLFGFVEGGLIDAIVEDEEDYEEQNLDSQNLGTGSRPNPTKVRGARTKQATKARPKASILVQVAKPRVEAQNPFSGTWVSERVDDEENFLQELEVSSRFSKLALKYAGSQQQTLEIDQEGNEFTIVSINDRREVMHKFTIGIEFYSENEKGEATTCSATWARGKVNGELIVRSKVDARSPSGGEHGTRLTRREILSSGQLLEEVRDEKSDKIISNRVYSRSD
ncbi:Fatty acid-binding protein, liver [Hondaea fermentalgiana]|uniref:Fatty acid-binding protein, liver n=1 Tax=Hondaea fermentalgiana TaxID=2315210 RepID=A0A2R5G9V2_9STRA|nr:Fatty acid-binding protein, liver [Hondaea fermentalgiana]|eukprot:GBG27089.1 Fatty acid-binding protein, liver [Hondaea fermentalgiana]